MGENVQEAYEKQDLTWLKNIELFVFDMDGTVYLGDELIDGARECLELVAKEKDFVYFTNNSSKSAKKYIEKLSRLGLPCRKDQIMTSGDVTIHHLNTQFKGKTVYLVGTNSLIESFKEAGIRLFEPSEEDPCVGECPDIVVVGFDTDITFHKMNRASAYIRRGATFLATHLDTNCPTETGFMIDCGSLCKAIACSSGVEPTFMGKPFSYTMDYVLSVCQVPREKIAFVGDRLYTDVATGVGNGASGILVLSGEATIKDVSIGTVKPDAIFSSLKEMKEYI